MAGLFALLVWDTLWAVGAAFVVCLVVLLVLGALLFPYCTKMERVEDESRQESDKDGDIADLRR